MLRPARFRRRSVLLGGLALPLVGCQPPGADSGVLNEYEPPPERWIPPEVVEVAVIVGVVALGVSWVGWVSGIAALSRIASFSRNFVSGAIRAADFLDRRLNPDPVAGAAALRPGRTRLLDMLIPPAHAAPAFPQNRSPPRPEPVESNDPYLNNAVAVAFVSGQATIRIAGTNDTDVDFLNHHIFSAIRSVDEPPPVSVAEVTGPSSLPSYDMAIPARQSYEHSYAVNLPVNQAYMVYTWCIPSSATLTDQLIANNAMLGPILCSCDPYDLALRDAIVQEVVTDREPVFKYKVTSPAPT